MTERRVLLIYKGAVATFFAPEQLPLTAVLSPSARLREDLALDALGLEELGDHLKAVLGRAPTPAALEACGTLLEVAQAAARELGDDRLDGKVWGWADTALPTCWSIELRSRTAGGGGAGGEGLLECPAGFSKDDKMFSRLRRAYRDLKRPFVHHWQTLGPAEQRQQLLLAAPLPLSAADSDFPVSLALLPSVHVEGLLGEALPRVLEERTGGEFRVLVRADLERARELAPRFACPAAWQDSVMLLEGRKEVKIKSHKDEARVRDQLVSGQAVPGRVWAVYLAASGSLSALLQALLEDFKKKQRSKQKSAVEQRHICDSCGKFAEKLSICSRCRNRWYCSKGCQSEDWPKHKKNCGDKTPSFALKFESHEEEDD